MKNLLHITTSLDQPELLENLVEKLADRPYTIQTGSTNPAGKRKTLETSSTETYLSGTIVINDLAGNPASEINMPFITSFLFTCIKEETNSCKIAWSVSLS
ncbi:MAG TPA: hypothetical protein VF487_17255 [Chitinophagaceae bacterium]